MTMSDPYSSDYDVMRALYLRLGNMLVDGGKVVVDEISNKGGDVITLIPTLDTSAYAGGDVLFVPTIVNGVARTNGYPSKLQSVLIVDNDDVGPEFDLLFLSDTVSIGSLNGAFSISDVNAVELLGWIDVNAADFIDLGGQRVAVYTPVSDGWHIELLKGTTISKAIYVAAINRDALTHSSSGLTFRFSVVFI